MGWYCRPPLEAPALGLGGRGSELSSLHFGGDSASYIQSVPTLEEWGTPEEEVGMHPPS